jgi:hypothetical protein
MRLPTLTDLPRRSSIGIIVGSTAGRPASAPPTVLGLDGVGANVPVPTVLAMTVPELI